MKKEYSWLVLVLEWNEFISDLSKEKKRKKKEKYSYMLH